MVGQDIVDESEDALAVATAPVNNMGQKLMIALPDCCLFPDAGPKLVVWLMQEILAVSRGIVRDGSLFRNRMGEILLYVMFHPLPDISVDVGADSFKNLSRDFLCVVMKSLKIVA